MARQKYEYLDEKGLARLAEDLEYRHPSTFTGTRAEWQALPAARKDLYKYVNFTDDDSDFIGLRHPTIFTGTRAEWYALSDKERDKYVLVCFTDDLSGIGWFLADVVEEGNMNPVTSNGVYQAIKDKESMFLTDTILLDFDQTLTAVYSDERITSETHFTVYYEIPSIAEVAEISAESGNGTVTFTAVTAPTGSVRCKMLCIN